MNLLLRLVQFCIGGCPHRHMYRERRKLHGTQVLHWVCEDCNYAVPAVHRTAREHREAVKIGAIKSTKAHRLPAEVFAIGMRRQSAQQEPQRRAQ